MIEELSQLKKAINHLSGQDQRPPAITYAMKVWESGIELCLQKYCIIGNNQRVWMDMKYLSDICLSTPNRFLK